MSKKVLRAGSLLLMVLTAGIFSSCQQTDLSQKLSEVATPATTRKAVDALDHRTALSRSARVSDVEYDLAIDISGVGKWFSGEVTIRFKLTAASSDLTIDFGGGTVHRMLVNGSPVNVDYNGFFLSLPAETLRRGANSVSIEFEHLYGEDGTGMHRFVDPDDGLHYLYTYLWPYYANRLFPVFDQPNLKARISLNVRAPENWTVVSTGTASTEPAGGGVVLWRFDTTPRMSTYVFSLHAGPYKIWEADAAGIPIRLMARRSLAEHVAVDEWLEVTRRGLDYYSQYFGIPYPFEKYDQLIVPDFNIGAMENIAAVTFAERYVQRQQSDRGEREGRSSVILHEMAHMWFGNLVTHDWWNGLWLNESFATQMAAMASVSTTEFKDTWHGFFSNAKPRAYGRDSLVTTHPIEVPVPSTADFFSVFDAITYQKGSSVLKQLSHYVGAENYRRGVSAYLQEHSYGTTELADFIGHQAKSSGINLDEWSNEWLFKRGFNTLSASADCVDGSLQALTITQTAPEEHPYLRRHQVDVALYHLDDDDHLIAGDVFSVEITGEETAVDVPDGTSCPVLINPNHADWTYARIILDEQSTAAVEKYLQDIPEALARSIFLAALFDRALAGEMPLAEYIAHAAGLAESEQNIRVQQQISSSIVAAVRLMQRLRPETDKSLVTLLPALEEQALKHAAEATTIDLKRNWFNTYTGVVSTATGLATVRQLLDGTTEIPGLPISPDLRWRLLTILSGNGAANIAAMVAAEQNADVSDYGLKRALGANAAIPDLTVKTKWLAELVNPETLTGLARQRAVMAELFPPNQTMLQLELLDQVLDALPKLSETSDPYFMSSYVSTLLTPMCVPESTARMQAFLDEQAQHLNSTALRFLREAHQTDSECLALRNTQ